MERPGHCLESIHAAKVVQIGVDMHGRERESSPKVLFYDKVTGKMSGEVGRNQGRLGEAAIR
jgi:hypothetical protein